MAVSVDLLSFALDNNVRHEFVEWLVNAFSDLRAKRFVKSEAAGLKEWQDRVLSYSYACMAVAIA